MNPRNFFAELKRRNVYKVAVAYAFVGWLLMQVAATVVPALHLPDGITTAVVVVTLLGFPIALVIAWAFEMTPEGMKRTENVSPGEVIPQWSARKFAAMIVSIALLAAALLVFQIVRSKSTSPAQPSPESATAAEDESIAVLPFVNMSSDKEQDYFSDGLSEELLNQLAQIPQLRVIARTSSFSFKGKEVDVATIAKALNVANVLEGSVRKSGNTLRITAQLVRASDSSHLWSQTYDRQMTDIFKVQDEIAGEVVAALKVKLLPTQQLPKTQRTSNPEAYEHYLLGMDILRQDRMQTSHLAAAEFQKAIALDPNYANAYVALANAQALAAEVASSPAQRAEGIKQALATVEEAITLAPDLASGYSSRGYLRYSRAWDWPGAEADFKRALALDPHNAALLSSVTRRVCSLADVRRKRSQWRSRRPRSTRCLPRHDASYGLLLFCSGQDAEARLAWQHALEINPERDGRTISSAIST